MKKEILRELADALIEILDEEEANEYNKIIECEIQKAREGERNAFCTILEKLYQAGDDRKQMTFEYLMRIRSKDAVKTPDHSELDQDPVHDFFTAPEEVKRPVYERALAKTQEEQEKKLDQPTVKCGHHQAMLEGAAVGLDQDGKCIDCGAEVLRTDTNK